MQSCSISKDLPVLAAFLAFQVSLLIYFYSLHEKVGPLHVLYATLAALVLVNQYLGPPFLPFYLKTDKQWKCACVITRVPAHGTVREP